MQMEDNSQYVQRNVQFRRNQTQRYSVFSSHL
jgi:hypothetical protein